MKRIAIILTILISALASGQQQHYPIKNFLGVNCYSWDIVSHYSWSNFTDVTNRKQGAIASTGISGIRLSIDADASKTDDNSAYWLSPQRNGFQTDTAIVLLRKKIPGLVVNLCYQNAPRKIQAEWSGVRSTVYRHYYSDASASTSYIDIAHDCAVLAARGGSNKNAPNYPVLQSPNWWEPMQTMFKGAGFYNIIAGGNELDNEYSNQYPLNGAQYAALWAPVYDSIKKTDPAMLVSTTGIANGDPKIISDAITWCKANRGGQLPWDIAEHHFYPWGWPLSGGLPGELSIIQEIKKVQTGTGSSLLTVGEWSWDVNTASPINAPEHDGYTAEEVRGQAAVRTLFKFSQIGVFSAYWYRLYPDYMKNIDSSGSQFATSALLKQTDDSCHIVRRTVGDYFAQVSVFGDYTFSSALRDDSVQVLKFTNPNHPDLYAAWTVERITQYTDGRGVSHPLWNERKYNYSLPLSGIRYDLNNDSSGTLKQQPFYGGTVQLSSNPVFITTTTILPLRDTDPLPPGPFHPPLYTVELYELYGTPGRLIMKKQKVDIQEFKAKLPRKHYYILKYYNQAINQTEKIYKQ